MIRKLWITSVAITDGEGMSAVLGAAQAAGASEIIHLPADWLAGHGVPSEGYAEITVPDPAGEPTLNDLLGRLDMLKAQIEARLAEN